MRNGQVAIVKLVADDAERASLCSQACPLIGAENKASNRRFNFGTSCRGRGKKTGDNITRFGRGHGGGVDQIMSSNAATGKAPQAGVELAGITPPDLPYTRLQGAVRRPIP
jgi:hypothetical protein